MVVVMCTGADGYLGWSSAVYFSRKSNVSKVVCIDNLSKRRMVDESDIKPYTEDNLIQDKINVLHGINKETDLVFEYGDITDNRFVQKMIIKYNPDIIIHTAQQSSSLFSRKNFDTCSWTIQNNTFGIVNLLWAIHSLNKKILLIKFSPLNRHSSNIYNSTKRAESDYAKILSKQLGICTIDLFHGHIYGMAMHKTLNHKLYPRLSYDNVFGGVLNRFLVQCVLGEKVFVQGNTSQEIGVIGINDLMKCIDLAIRKANRRSKYIPVEAFSEIISISEVIRLMRKCVKELDLSVTFRKIKTSKVEGALDGSVVSNNKVLSWGLKPSYLKNNISRNIKELIDYRKHLEVS